MVQKEILDLCLERYYDRMIEGIQNNMLIPSVKGKPEAGAPYGKFVNMALEDALLQAKELGLRVKNIRYFDSQPWGFDQNLLLGYFCELDGERDIVLDTGELATGEWVHYSDVPEDPEGLSLTREMMSVFQQKFLSEKMS